MKICHNDKHPGMGMCLCNKCQTACPQNPKAWDIVKEIKVNVKTTQDTLPKTI